MEWKISIRKPHASQCSSAIPFTASVYRPLLVVVNLHFLGIFVDVGDKVLFDLVASTTSHPEYEIIKRGPAQDIDMVA